MHQKRTAVFYKDPVTQKEPAKEWIESIKDKALKARVLIRITRAEFGNFGDHKSVGAGVWELKISVGPGLRIYYSLEGSELILLLMGGDKSSQIKDIQMAKKYLIRHQAEK